MSARMITCSARRGCVVANNPRIGCPLDSLSIEDRKKIENNRDNPDDLASTAIAATVAGCADDSLLSEFERPEDGPLQYLRIWLNNKQKLLLEFKII